jgi:hypothetical protein
METLYNLKEWEMAKNPVFRLVGFLVITGLVFLVVGCGNSTAQKEATYKEQWTKQVNQFEKRVSSDDKKANALAEKNDMAGLFRLINERKAYVKTVQTQILKLNTPDKYQNVQILTLFYLLSLEQRLTAQNNLTEAILSGKPTTDLKTIADAYVTRTQQIGNELGIEISDAGLTLKAVEEVPNSSAPKSSVPTKK